MDCGTEPRRQTANFIITSSIGEMSVPPQTVRSSQGVSAIAVLWPSATFLSSPLPGEGDQRGPGVRFCGRTTNASSAQGGRFLGEDGSRSAVLIVLPAAAHASRSSLDRLAHEHGLKEELDGGWAVRPLDIVRDGGRTMLCSRTSAISSRWNGCSARLWRSGASWASPSASLWLWAKCISAVLSIRTSSRPTFW